MLRLPRWPELHKSPTRRSRRVTIAAHPHPAPTDATSRAVAGALYDLLQDSRAGVTRLRVVGARQSLVTSLGHEGARRGLPAERIGASVILSHNSPHR